MKNLVDSHGDFVWKLIKFWHVMYIETLYLLKHTIIDCIIQELLFSFAVTPFMGVWIEICQMPSARNPVLRHTLYGCVD